MEKLIDYINGIPEEEVEVAFTEDEKVALQAGSLGNRYTVKDNVFVEKMVKNIDNYVNGIRFGDKKLDLRPINMTTDNKTLSTSQAILRFRSLMAVGEVIQVPLWHSGIWVTIKPPTHTDIVNMQIQLANNEITLGKETNTLIYSNYSIVYDRIITEFVMKHIDSHTLKLKDGESLLDHILLYDYHTLVLAMLSAMYPKGINIVRGCYNTTVLDKNKKPLCDFVASGQVDPKKLLWVDRGIFTNNMLSHMSNRLDSSMSIDSVKEYQLSIKELLDKEVEITGDTGSKFKIKFSVPTIKKHLERGEKWVTEVIKMAEELYTDGDDASQKNFKINELVKASLLNIYNTFIKEVILDDGVVIKDEEAIKEILSIMTADDKAFDTFYKDIKQYMTESTVAIIATPSFTCPTCGKEQNEGRKGSFKEFIPLNIVEHFFGLCALRTEKPRNRQI